MSGFLCTLLLSGFTGKEKYVELQGAANGRSSSNFRGGSNIRLTLPAGTRGEILDTVLLRSGNFGIKMKVINGPQAGRVMWVYHKMKGDSTLALFEEVPSNWDNAPQTDDPEMASAALTIRETRTMQDPTPVEYENSADASDDDDEAQSSELSAVATIDETNKRLQKTDNNDGICADCTVASSGNRSLLRPATRSMAPACNKFMNSDGQVGSSGQIIYNTLNSSSNRAAFTKRNAMGKLCPKFNQLSDGDKLLAWTWFWTALAREESACNVQVVHATRSGGRVINPRVGYGLWALEKSSSVRRWRGSECSNVSDTRGQARCAIEIMKDTQLEDGDSAYDSGSYWGPVRRAQRQIIPHMKRLTLCF